MNKKLASFWAVCGLMVALVNTTSTSAHPRNSQIRECCTKCGGSGRCNGDWPAGSGRDVDGHFDTMCQGSERCYYCSGKGSW